eukprot:571702-Amphidinium_carterae.1
MVKIKRGLLKKYYAAKPYNRKTVALSYRKWTGGCKDGITPESVSLHAPTVCRVRGWLLGQR